MRAAMLHLGRRAFLALTALLVPAWSLSASTRQTTVKVSLDDFLELSQRLLGRSKLDPDIAQIYLAALNADADTAAYLATLVASNGNPTPEQAVLSRTIIEWWYTGVYTVDRMPRLATHTGALMWSAMDLPAPGTCAATFGAWSKPPRSIP